MKIILKILLFPAAVMLLCRCDKSDLGSSLSDIYIPDFSNTWAIVKGNAIGHFNINSSTVTDSSKASGVFSGNNVEENATFSVLAVTGTFLNTKIKMTISSDSLNAGTAPLADSSFTGIVDTLPDRTHPYWRLTNDVSHDSLVLHHG
jgi:hypothetical protein